MIRWLIDWWTGESARRAAIDALERAINKGRRFDENKGTKDGKSRRRPAGNTHWSAGADTGL
jgi:hypothetical protein